MSRTKIEVVLCSKSRIKRDATDIALARLDGLKSDVIERDGDSGVPNQPYEHIVTLGGAIHRAHGLRPEWPGRYILAVENGIAPRGQGYVDLAYVVVLTPDGRIVIRHSESVPVPPELVERSRATDWNVTAGKLEAARTPGCDHADPHVVWSGGKTDRRTLLASAILDAMKAATLNHGA